MADVVKDFYNEWTDYLSKRTKRHEVIFRGLERMNLEPGKTVLDLGCGTGITSIFMARQGCKVTGVDFAENLIEYAKEHNSNKNTDYIVGDITDIRLEKPFDLICLTDVIEHIDPSKISNLMETVQNHAHYLTVVYVNIPYHLFAEYGRDKFQQQPVETAIPMQLLLTLFEKAGWAPMDIYMYGLRSPVEYVELSLVTKNNLNLMWDHYYNPSEPEEGSGQETDSLDGEK
jgi:SAM-dependent methyltransferase